MSKSQDFLVKTTRRVETQEDKEWRFNKEIGEEWIDSNGNKWKKTSSNSRISMNERKIGPVCPYFCPKCNSGVRVVDEFYVISKGHCLECELSAEWEKTKEAMQNGN